MRYREVRDALLAEGCTSKPGKGSHEKRYCPCGRHIAVINRHQTVSPGVIADVTEKMECLPKGWLQ